MGFGHTVSILLPVCNESLVIERVVREWVDQIFELPEGSKIFIDDANSTDGTAEILRCLKDEFPSLIEIEFRPDRDGFKNAVSRLYGVADGQYVFVADTDGQYFASDFPYFLERVKAGDVFVKGVKINRKDGIPRRAFSFLMNRFVVVVIGLPFLDYNSSHYLIKKDLLDKIKDEGIKFKHSINVEITMKAILANIQYSIIYVRHQTRAQGVSRGNPPLKFLKFGLRTIQDIWKLKSDF
jgi:dolichol-phosphate mannosyltransferase